MANCGRDNPLKTFALLSDFLQPPAYNDARMALTLGEKDFIIVGQNLGFRL